ncbi:MAG: hypothetical protein U0939_10490 [Pirellulales bacterium]
MPHFGSQPQVGAFAAQLGSAPHFVSQAGLQQRDFSLQQRGSLQHFGAGAQHFGSGAQHFGSQPQLPPPPSRPANALPAEAR